MYLQQNIKHLRKNEDLSQTDFGKLFNKSRSNIDSYERGTAKPDDETKKKIADYFSISVEKLMFTDLRKTQSQGEQKVSSPPPLGNAGADIMEMNIGMEEKVILLREQLGMLEIELEAWKSLANIRGEKIAMLTKQIQAKGTIH